MPDSDAEFVTLATFQRSDAKLRAYWIAGLGAAKIRWGTGGDFTRCVKQLRKYVGDPKGLCAEYHREATGMWPGDKRNLAADGAIMMDSNDSTTTETTMSTTATADTDLADKAMPVIPEPDGDDCPEGQHRDEASGECVDDEDEAAYAALATQDGEHFRTSVTEGVSTGWRSFAANAITWREPPFAFHEQVDSSAHGGAARTVQRGIITRAERDGDTIHFYGRLDLRSPDTVDYARRLAEGFAVWSSVGPDESVRGKAVEYVWPAQADGESNPLADMLMAEPEEMIFHNYNVAEISAVSVPALADARVEPTQELLDELTALGVLDATPAKSDEPIVAAGYTITISECPPAAYFDEPADADLPPFGSIRMDEHGRLVGLLAPANVNHRSFGGRNVKVPMGNVDYTGWMNKAWRVAEGHTVDVGVITMNCGHASVNPGDRSYTHRREHYDNSCSIAAHARVYEKPGLGVALAGVVAPWLDAEDVGRLLSCDLSGDWPPHPDKPGWLDFIAALAVPAGGFANRAKARASEGLLVASAVPVRFGASAACTDGDGGCDLDLRRTLERIAVGIGRDTRSRMGDLRERVHSGNGVSSGV